MYSINMDLEQKYQEMLHNVKPIKFNVNKFQNNLKTFGGKQINKQS